MTEDDKRLLRIAYDEAKAGFDAAQADGSEMTRAGLSEIRARLAEEVG